jgi:polyadenylate-binding protein
MSTPSNVSATTTGGSENVAPSMEAPTVMEAPVPNLGGTMSGGGGGETAQPFHSASLYVGDLAPDVNEGLLYEIFNAVGPVASIRVCRDAVTRRSLGYAYVNYHQIADAERALDTMNYTQIKTRPCRIMWSQRDPSLRRSGVGNIFVKNLHESIDNKQLYDTFSLFGNILSCKVVNDRESGGSMGYGYVHYETAEAANAAIEKLDGMLIDGQEVQVGHFMRRNERPGLASWTNCYVKNVPYEWDDAKLNAEFSKFGEVLSATVAVGYRRKKSKKEEDQPETEEKTEGESEEETPVEADVEAEAKAKPEEEKETTNQTEEPPQNGSEEKEERILESLGYGFVSFAEHEGAAASVETLNGTVHKTMQDGEEIERELYVGRAQKKAERQKELSAKFESLKMDRIAKLQGVNLYVKNLDDAVTDDILRNEFSVIGTITSARVMKNMKDGVSRGFGFVCFSTPEEATRAVNEMNGKIIGNKPIFVALAQRKDVRRAQLEAQHNRTQGSQGQQPNAAMMRGPMGGPMGYPGAAMPVYMQRPGPGGAIQPVYPMMPQMMAQPGAGGQPRAGQQPRGYPNVMQQQQQQRGGVYPMPAYGVVPQPGRGGRGPNQGNAGRGGRGGRGPGGQQMQRVNVNVPNQGGNRGQPVKFNQQARNAGMQAQQPPPQQQSIPQANESLTASALASATPEMQKNMIGERLYPLIHQTQPELAGKITGMLLEMDNSELLHLLESPEALTGKITEALQVLDAHSTGSTSG